MRFILLVCLAEAAMISLVGGDLATATLLFDVPKNGSLVDLMAELTRAAAMQGIRVIPQRSLTDGAVEPASDPDTVYDLVPAVAVGADSAYVDCACIDHVKNATWADRIASHVSRGGLQVGDTKRSRDYGSAVCKVWDHGTDTCSAAESHHVLSCRRKWCWVDAANCSRPDVTYSKKLPGLAYSYTTCGSTGKVAAGYAPTLPVVAADMFPQNIWSRAGTGHLKGGAEPSQAQKHMAEVAYQILKESGLPPSHVSYRPISRASLGKWKSIYSACVYDVGIGNLDLCLGDFWFTQERNSIQGASFVPIASEALRVIMPKVHRHDNGIRSFNDWWSAMSDAFLPFSPGLWASVIIVLISTSALYYYVERPRGQEHVGVGMGHSVYQMMSSFASFGANFEPQTLSGRIIVLGVAFFLTILGASFTANTATFLVRASMESAQYKDIASVLQANNKLCITAVAIPMLRERYPELDRLAVPVNGNENTWTSADVPYLLSKGVCEGAVLGEYNIRGQWTRGEYCNYEIVGEPAFNYIMGFYTSQRLVERLSFAVSSLTESGVLANIEAHMFSKGSTCADTGDTAEDIGVTQLTISHMAGNISLVIIFCIISLSMHCLLRRTDEATLTKYAACLEMTTGIDFDGDGTVGHIMGYHAVETRTGGDGR